MNEPLMLTLCLEEDSILVSKAILETLEHPKQVQMLINEERQMLLLQACTVDDREAVVIPPDTMVQFEMSGHALLRRIRRLTGWTDNQPRVIYGNSRRITSPGRRCSLSCRSITPLISSGRNC